MVLEHSKITGSGGKRARHDTARHGTAVHRSASLGASFVFRRGFFRLPKRLLFFCLPKRAPGHTRHALAPEGGRNSPCLLVKWVSLTRYREGLLPPLPHHASGGMGGGGETHTLRDLVESCGVLKEAASIFSTLLCLPSRGAL